MDNQPININQNGVAPELEKKSVGPMVGLVIVVIIIILGGLYFWKEQTDKAYEDTMMEKDEVAMINEQSSSDEVSLIEADLQATSINSIDTEYSAIDAELQAQ